MDRELARLADHNKPGLGAEPARRTGEQRGGVKEVTTKPAGAAEKLNQKSKEAAAKLWESVNIPRSPQPPVTSTSTVSLKRNSGILVTASFQTSSIVALEGVIHFGVVDRCTLVTRPSM